MEQKQHGMQQQQYQGPDRRQSQTQYPGDDRRKPEARVDTYPPMSMQERKEEQERIRQQQEKYDDTH